MRFTVPALVVVLTALPSVAHAQQQFADLGDFKLESGEVIRHCRIGYRTFGRLDARRANAVLFLTWFSGTSEPLADMFGHGKMVPGERFGIAVDALGDGISSSPSNSTVQPRMKFPRFTIRDMVESQRQLLRLLRIDHLEAVMGVSMGGMQAFQWAVSHPLYMDKVVAIPGSPRPAAYDLLLWQAQNEAVMLDPAWKGGEYQTPPSGRLVAAINALTDMTPERFGREHRRDRVLAAIAEDARDVERFDTNNRIRQTQAILAHDVSSTFGGSLERAAASVKARMLVVVTASDHIVTPGPALEFARAARAQVLKLDNDCGHAGPNCEYDRVKERVGAFLDR
jgi:homoserine O-acetyltransferase